jgi:hypothetical protein
MLLKFCFKSFVGSVDVKLALPHLFVRQFLGRLHLMQSDEPLNNLRSPFKVLANLVCCVNDVLKQRMEHVLLAHANVKGVQERDEGLRRCDYKTRIRRRFNALTLVLARRLLDREGQTNSNPFASSWALQLGRIRCFLT